jgi:hypothetical protein
MTVTKAGMPHLRIVPLILLPESICRADGSGIAAIAESEKYANCL